jgi:hypothetical protein
MPSSSNIVQLKATKSADLNQLFKSRTNAMIFKNIFAERMAV